MCEYFEVPCPLCKEKIMRKDMPEHLNHKCKYREATCEFCKHKMALTDLKVPLRLLNSVRAHYHLSMWIHDGFFVCFYGKLILKCSSLLCTSSVFNISLTAKKNVP